MEIYLYDKWFNTSLHNWRGSDNKNETPVVCVFDITVPYPKKNTMNNARMSKYVHSVSCLFGMNVTMAAIMSESEFKEHFPDVRNRGITVSITSIKQGILTLFLETISKNEDERFLSYLNLFSDKHADYQNISIDEYGLRLNCDLIGIKVNKIRTRNTSGAYSL